MLIPIGHDQQTVRRLPWVSLVIIGLNILVFLLSYGVARRVEEEGVRHLRQAIEYWQEHPYLEFPEALVALAVPPGERNKFRTMVEALRGAGVDVDAEKREEEQLRLNQMARAVLEAHQQHPYLSFGLVPAHIRVLGFLTSMFMHGGWLHLLSNMFILFLAGPPVEDAYGRPGFAALYLVSGVVASLAHIARFPDSESALIGASGALAGVMGAFLVRCGQTKIRFFYWWFLRGGTFDAPAWLILPLWLLQQIFYGTLTKGEGGVAYWAHVGGFVFGVLAAGVVKWFKLEERYVHPKIEAEITLQQHPALVEGLELLARGEVEPARASLARAIAAEPANPDAHLAMWQSYLQGEEPLHGVDEMVKVIEIELKKGELGLALDHWRELVAHTGLGGPAPLRFRLASQLAEAGRVEATEVFRHLAEDAEAGLLADKARRRLGLPETPAATGGVAQAPPPTEGWGGATGAEAKPVPTEAPVPPPEEPPPVTPGSLWVETSSLERLEEAGVVLRDAAGVSEVLLYSLVDAVAVGGIAGGAKPYLVVDLVVGFATERRRVFRIPSTTMDPRQVLGWFDARPLEAFQEVVRRIVEASAATLLPGPEAIAKLRMFDSLAEFEAEVYGIERP